MLRFKVKKGVLTEHDEVILLGLEKDLLGWQTNILEPMFKEHDSTYLFYALKAIHTTRGPDRVHHRSAGDGAGPHTPARPRARLASIAPRRPGQTRPTPPLPLGSQSRLCSLGPADPG